MSFKRNKIPENNRFKEMRDENKNYKTNVKENEEMHTEEERFLMFMDEKY